MRFRIKTKPKLTNHSIDSPTYGQLFESQCCAWKRSRFQIELAMEDR
jgi:hypothetical protein